MLRVCLSLVAVAWLVCASVAAAQSDPGRDAEARGLFEAGRAAFDQGRYQDALGYFDRAYQLSKRPQLLYNLGQVHDRLRHDEEALQAFQQYLRQVPDASNRTEVEHRIQAMRQAMFGTLHFTLTPATAEVWIDGEIKALDRERRLQVTTGSHEIAVRAPGYAELRQRMNVRGGEVVEMPVTLQAASTDAPTVTPASVITPAQPTPTEPNVTPAPAQPSMQPQIVEPSQGNVAVSTQTGPSPSGGMSTATVLGIVATVGAVGLLATGAVTAVIGSSEFDKINKECRLQCTREEINDRGDSLGTYALLTNVGFIGGGALAGLATVLFIVGGKRTEQAPASQPSLVIGPTSIIAQGSF